MEILLEIILKILKYRTLEILYERILEILNYRMDIGNLIRMDIGNRMEGNAFVSGKGPPQRHVSQRYDNWFSRKM